MSSYLQIPIFALSPCRCKQTESSAKHHGSRIPLPLPVLSLLHTYTNFGDQSFLPIRHGMSQSPSAPTYILHLSRCRQVYLFNHSSGKLPRCPHQRSKPFLLHHSLFPLPYPFLYLLSLTGQQHFQYLLLVSYVIPFKFM